jgi:iron complex outermembrane receptor protein
MLKRTKVSMAVMAALSGVAILAPTLASAQSQTVEVTGSRLKRADVEGSLPVTTISREELQASGSVTVAEFMRSSTFASAGNFRPQSGSSAQSFAGIDLRGLGSNRTLVLIDGRRLPKAPNVGDSADLNTVPMAAVERIEILTDGASAIYGSDAIGGVVNIITRKDFEGMVATVGHTNNSMPGGERPEANAIIGINGDKGRMVAGVSRTGRGMVFTRDRPWGATPGVSSFGNNIVTGGLRSLGTLKGDPKIGCTDPNFYLASNGTCSYDFNAVAADEAQIDQSSLFFRGETKLSNDWNAYLNSSVSRVKSFGRYAPTPASLTVAANTPNNPTATNLVIRHRTAAAGNRDTTTDNNLYDALAGLQGKLSSNVDVDFGLRSTESKYLELGRNYIVRPILEQYVNSGAYNLFAPNANPSDVLNAIKATISRDSLYSLKEVYGTATINNLFKMGGGQAAMVVGAERRTEKYADIYDSLSEAGVIEGSAGNSAGGDRKVTSLYSELLLPVSKQIEVSLAARYEKYSDYGSDLAPKASVRWQPAKNLTFRASAGTGFGAPSLPILTQKESFSAESVFDPRTCIAFGGSATGSAANNCNIAKLVQVDSYTASNPSLKSEQSTQFAFGAVWDATSFLTMKADYYNIKIDDKISLIGAQDLIDRSNGDDPRPIPAGLYVQRDAAGVITRVQQGYGNEGTIKASGLDITAEASWKHADSGTFRHRLRWSEVLSYKDDDTEIKGLLGLPKRRITLGSAWNLREFGAAWNINMIGKNGTQAGRTASTYVTHDVQLTYTTSRKGKLSLGMVNLTEKMPELVAYGSRNFNFNLYDSYGRQTYVRYDHKF